MRRAGLRYTNSRLSNLVEKRVLELRGVKSQLEISVQAGFAQPSMLAMIKRGSSKLPLDRVPGLAAALEVDPRLLFLLALEQSYGDTVAQAIMEIFSTVVTRNEVPWLMAIRELSDGSDPRLTGRALAALRGIFGK